MTFDNESISSLIASVKSLVAQTIKEVSELQSFVDQNQNYSSQEYIDSHKKLSKLQVEKETQEQLLKLLQQYEETKWLITDASTDADMRMLAEDEVKTLETKIPPLYDAIFSKKSKYQDVVVEIRSGAGGDEAAIFAHDLFKMYSLYADKKGWKIEISDSDGSMGSAFRYVNFFIRGDGAYDLLQYESGVHRVQRIPATENAGRIHTSTATVAILPEVEDVDIHINPSDLEFEAYRSSGPGGQNVNKVSTAVRLRHIPSGLIITCQESRSQLKNRENAVKMLKSKLYLMQLESATKEMTDLRRQQIGGAERSEKIRTYNYPQSRITDHRIKQSWFNITGAMAGDIDDMLHDVKKGMDEPHTISEDFDE
jgi:peptide chain release factor 1